MSQEDIYRILLETKQDTGKILATLQEHEKNLVNLADKHETLSVKHDDLKESHDSFKGKYLAITSFIGITFGAFITWLFNKK